MVDNENGSSGTPDQSGGENQESGKGTVAYETYKRAISEVKNLKNKLGEFASKEAEREQATLSEQGKYKEALEAAQKKVKELESKVEVTTKTYAKSLFTKEAKTAALSMGAMSEALEDIVKVGDWSGIEIDEDFNINGSQLKDAIAKLAKDKPFYFKRSAASPKDVVTSPEGKAQHGKSINELSSDDIIKLLKQS